MLLSEIILSLTNYAQGHYISKELVLYGFLPELGVFLSLSGDMLLKWS